LRAGIEDNQNATILFRNFLTFGNVTIFPRKELHYTQNFTVMLEFHCFLASDRKPFGDAHYL
jgi:hypothetical protein